MAESEEVSPNLRQGPDRGPRTVSRPIGDMSGANCREIKKMADTEGVSSNSDAHDLTDIFDTLTDWEYQLQQSESARELLLNHDIEGLEA